MKRGVTLAMAVLVLSACGGGDDGAQIKTTPDEMTPEEALECLQDAECLERIGEEALDEATGSEETVTDVSPDEDLMADAQAAMESLEYAAGGAGAQTGDDLRDWVTEEMVSAYETLDFALGDGEITEDETGDVLGAIGAITAAVSGGMAARERGGGTAGVGEAITLHGYEDGLEMRVNVQRVIDPAPAEQYFGPSRGKRFVAIQLRLTNAGTVVYNDSPGNGAALIDNRDQQYTESLYATPACQYIGSSVRIRPEDSRSGCLVFEVPKRSKVRAFQLTLESGFADETGEWTLR